MKSILLRLAPIPLLALAMGAVAIPSEVHAQDANRPRQAQRNRGDARSQVRDRLQQVVEKLDLSDEQKAKIQPIMEELRNQMRTAMQNGGTPQERRQQAREAMTAARKQVAEILTPEQRARFVELMREQRGAATQPTAGGGIVDRIEKVALGLDLTPQQQAKVKQLSDEYRDEVAAILKDNSGKDETNKQSRTVIMEFRSRLVEVLTPEQSAEFNRKLGELRPGREAGGTRTKQGAKGKLSKRPDKGV